VSASPRCCWFWTPWCPFCNAEATKASARWRRANPKVDNSSGVVAARSERQRPCRGFVSKYNLNFHQPQRWPTARSGPRFINVPWQPGVCVLPLPTGPSDLRETNPTSAMAPTGAVRPGVRGAVVGRPRTVDQDLVGLGPSPLDMVAAAEPVRLRHAACVSGPW